jgi:hypothetical protein
MARSFEARIARLEAPHRDPTRLTMCSYTILRACYAVLSRLDGVEMPTDAELRAMARAEALSGRPLDFTRVLEAVWNAEVQP